MAQSDYVLDGNGGGGAVLLDINEAVQALVSSNQGTGAPSPTYPSMLWADETTGLLKIRSSNNTQWWTVGTLNEEGLGLGSAVGDIILSQRATIAKHLKPEGQAISRTTYAEYFALVGTTYGAGNGSTTFNMPDARDRALVFPNSDSTKGDIRSLGDIFGESRHTMTEAEMVSHVHPIRRRSAGTQSGTPEAIFADNNGAGYQASQTGTVLATGGGTPFNVIQKSIVLGNLFIKVLP
jgi:microcystin-dependent protein